MCFKKHVEKVHGIEQSYKRVKAQVAIELFKVSESSAMQLSNQSDTPEVLYNLFLRIKTGVPL